MIADPEITETMLGALLPRTDLVPADYVIAYYARYDVVLSDYHRYVHVHPRDIDPTTFNFGTPGAYASLTVRPNGDDGFGYHVHVFATNVAYTYQQAGHAVTFTDAAEAIRVAVWLVSDEVHQQQRGRG